MIPTEVLKAGTRVVVWTVGVHETYEIGHGEVAEINAAALIVREQRGLYAYPWAHISYVEILEGKAGG